MSNEYDFDVAVIGGGPAGYVAGIRAAQLGARACVIEKGHLGGTCTNVGCIPTKALWQAARVKLEVERAAQFGMHVSDVQVDFGQAAGHRDKVVSTLRGGIESLLKGNSVELLRGEAAFADPHKLHVAGDGMETEVSARNVIIATGSRPIELPHVPVSRETIIDSSDAVLAD